MVWTFLLGLLKKIPWQLWLLSGVLFTFWLYGVWQFERGQKDTQDKWDESRKLGQAIVEDLRLRANAVVTVIEHRVETETRLIKEKGDVIVEKIPVYIPASTPDLPGGFRVLHDAASASRVPTEAELPGLPVSVAATTKTIVENYATCHTWQSQVQGWEDWYQEQFLVWQSAVRKQQAD